MSPCRCSIYDVSQSLQYEGRRALIGSLLTTGGYTLPFLQNSLFIVYLSLELVRKEETLKLNRYSIVYWVLKFSLVMKGLFHLPMAGKLAYPSFKRNESFICGMVIWHLDPSSLSKRIV